MKTLKRTSGIFLQLIAIGVFVSAFIIFVNQIFDLNLNLVIGSSLIATGKDPVIGVINLVLALFLFSAGKLLVSVEVERYVTENKLKSVLILVFTGTLFFSLGYFLIWHFSGGRAYEAIRKDNQEELKKILRSENFSQVEINEMMHTSVRENALQCVKLLAEQANFSAKFGDSQYTFLEAAVMWGQVETIELLLNYKQNINHQNLFGHTLLHLAILYRGKYRNQIVKLLMKKKCDLQLKDIYGKTALDYAESKGLSDIVLLLQNTGNQ